MNKMLLSKLNKLMNVASKSDNVISKDVLIDELYKNKELRTEFQVNNALTYLDEHNIKVVYSDTFYSTLDKLVEQAKQSNMTINDSDIVAAFSNNLNHISTQADMTKVFEYLADNDVDVNSNETEVDSNVTNETEESNAVNESDNIEDSIDMSIEQEDLCINLKEKDLDVMKEISENELEQMKTDFEDEDDFMEESNEAVISDTSISNPDPFNMYMKDMQRNGTPLLTAKEEIELSKAIKNGDEKALDRMVTSNLKLVISIAKHYVGLGIDLIDLVQEGNLGLMKAIYMFNPDLGYKFSTYATWWIRQAITRSIANDARLIRMPVHAVEQARLNLRAQHILTEELNRQPTSEEVAKYVNEHKMLASSSSQHITAEKVDLYNNFYMPNSIVSLHTPINSEDDHGDQSYLGDFIISDDLSVEDIAMNNHLKELVEDVLTHVLNEKEINIVKRRFGMNVDHCMTLEEIGLVYNVTRERIRQIEATAIKKLRHSHYAKRKLAEFAEKNKPIWL